MIRFEYFLRIGNKVIWARSLFLQKYEDGANSRKKCGIFCNEWNKQNHKDLVNLHKNKTKCVGFRYHISKLSFCKVF